jgi:hypothetical protein
MVVDIFNDDLQASGEVDLPDTYITETDEVVKPEENEAPKEEPDEFADDPMYSDSSEIKSSKKDYPIPAKHKDNENIDYALLPDAMNLLKSKNESRGTAAKIISYSLTREGKFDNVEAAKSNFRKFCKREGIKRHVAEGLISVVTKAIEAQEKNPRAYAIRRLTSHPAYTDKFHKNHKKILSQLNKIYQGQQR